MDNRRITLIIMGPCACGKSEIGRELAKKYNCAFLDADDLHSQENISKMRQGTPLTDEDRIPWLFRVRDALIKMQRSSETSDRTTNLKISRVGACSVLKSLYRNILRKGYTDTECESVDRNEEDKFIFVFLDCTRQELERRLAQRSGHFMKSIMLDSQLATLERPQEWELSDTIVVNGDLGLSDVVEEIHLKLVSYLNSHK